MMRSSKPGFVGAGSGLLEKSTSVVLPWSTWAMIAMLRMCCADEVPGRPGPDSNQPNAFRQALA